MVLMNAVRRAPVGAKCVRCDVFWAWSDRSIPVDKAHCPDCTMPLVKVRRPAKISPLTDKTPSSCGTVHIEKHGGDLKLSGIRCVMQTQAVSV